MYDDWVLKLKIDDEKAGNYNAVFFLGYVNYVKVGAIIFIN